MHTDRERDLAELLADENHADPEVRRYPGYLEDLRTLFPLVQQSLSADQLVALDSVVDRARRWNVRPARIVLDAIRESLLAVPVGQPS
jgi:hypothetical protein